MERLDIIDCPIDPPEPKDVFIPYDELLEELIEALDFEVENIQ